MTGYIPTEGDFVMVVRNGLIVGAGKVDSVDHTTQTARIQPVGQPHARPRIPFTELRRRPRSARPAPEENQ